ncbi:MAG: transpeptidase family protein [Melioribacteraceae bacterium]|nr:transpeptidase family protein [Melioribacteraceae bacterium]MCF8354518.1 transpeptidase family protein [Melioribacteraceae bacterium]MCF8394287.1 transpeptidase family protein [Melioribacteraceae bacterium]MCF8418187.1 transpeptidase family protein [Melioribacteraceae bacterium]
MNNSRALLILILVILLFGVLAIRLFNIQINNHDKYKYWAEKQQNKSVMIRAERGLIKDCKGEVLAYTKDDISYLADTRMLNAKEKDSIAVKFSQVFGKSKDYYLSLLTKNKGNVILEKKAPRHKSVLLNDFVFDGLVKIEDYTRSYPYGSLAAHVIGYVDLKNIVGVNGIERQFNDELTGNDGYVYIERDVLGRTVSVNDELSRLPVSGNTISLTINATFQKILEAELSRGLAEFKGESVSGIIMDPNTGAIIAMANLPSYDPGNYNLFNDFERKNRAVTDTYEPGSTIKALVMSMLVEENLVNENEIVDTENGKYKFYNATIKDVHKHEYLTVREVIEQSSNIGMVKLSDRIEANTFYKYLRDYGFGNGTSIELPSESPGYLKKPSQYSKLTKPFMSHGYEISTTPLQMITAFSALINGGILYQPQLINEIVNPGGEIIQKFEPKRIRRIVSDATSEKLKDFMKGVVEHGTATAARIDNVSIGGKTGTSQKLIDNSYSNDKYNVSFIGFMPAEMPQLVCIIYMDSPKIGKYGGVVCAPIFKRVAEQLLEADLNIIPDKGELNESEKFADQFFANIKNNESQDLLKTSNIEEPSNNNKNEKLIVRTVMPNLINRSYREAVALVSELNLECKFIGTGVVVSQSIKPGAKLNDGDLLMVKCESRSKLNSLRLK